MKRGADRPFELLAGPILVALVLEVLAFVWAMEVLFLFCPLHVLIASGWPLSVRTCLLILAVGTAGLGALHAAPILADVLRSRRRRGLLAAVPGVGLLLIGILTAEWVSRMPTISELVERAEREIADGVTDTLHLLVLWEAPEVRGIVEEFRVRGGDEGFFGAAVLFRLGDRSERNRRIILDRIEAARTRKGQDSGKWLREGCRVLVERYALGCFVIQTVAGARTPTFWHEWVDLERQLGGESRPFLPEESALFGDLGIDQGRRYFTGALVFGAPSLGSQLRDRVESGPAEAVALARVYRRAEGHDDLIRAAHLFGLLYAARNPPDGAMAYAHLEALHAVAVLYDEEWDRKAFRHAFDRIRQSPKVWAGVLGKENLLRFERELRK